MITVYEPFHCFITNPSLKVVTLYFIQTPPLLYYITVPLPRYTAACVVTAESGSRTVVNDMNDVNNLEVNHPSEEPVA